MTLTPAPPRLFADRFATPDGRANFIRVEYREPHEIPDADYPYVLTTGRLMAQYQSGTQTRRVPSLSQAQVQPEAHLHPDLARRLDRQRRYRLARIPPGHRRFPRPCERRDPSGRRVRALHWGGASAANALTDPALIRIRGCRPSRSARSTSPASAHRDDVHLLTRPPVHTRHSAPTKATLNQLLQPSRRKDLPMISQNRFLQGVYPFEGAGLDKPVPISSDLVHLVPDGVISQALYFRGGNTTDELIPSC